MTKNLLVSLPTLLLAYSISFAAYSSITPSELLARLTANDTLLILDVREWSEYTAGHIAEPAGRLPFTPACMPWTTGVLAANFHRLPKNIDIIVHCLSGGRSASASKFLSDSGYARIFNMTGGFNAWTYEKRIGGFGDGSGHWIWPTITRPDTIKHDSGAVIFYPASMTGIDSLYCEVHFASGKQPIPGDAPVSNIAGLFRTTALNKFGLSLFSGDSLQLGDSIGIVLVPRSKTGGPLPVLTQTNVSALAEPGQWKQLAFDYHYPSFQENGKVLRQWYNAAGMVPMAVRQRQVFSTNGLQTASSNRPAAVCDLRGRLVSVFKNDGLLPTLQGCGYYIIDTHREQRYCTPIIGSRSITPSTQHRP